jgi:hypothetical protein
VEDEMVGLGVFPIVRAHGEGDLAEGIDVLIGELAEGFFDELDVLRVAGV